MIDIELTSNSFRTAHFSLLLMCTAIPMIGASLTSYIWRDGTLSPAILLSTLLHLLDQLLSVMLLLITAAFLLKRYGTQAIPLPAPFPTSAFEAPIFARDDPSDGCQGRTVLDILWSCLATTFACTWVSVHPNVPFKGEGKWTLLRRRIFLMFFSILAPEFMIMWAFKQWRGAVMIKETVNDAIKKASPNPQNPVCELWTTTHGHFLQMGGFRLRTLQRENFFYSGVGPVLRSLIVRNRYWKVTRISESRDEDLIPKQFYFRQEVLDESWTNIYNPDNELTDNVWEGVLTVDALAKLLGENLIQLPTITDDEINDKSKGDALSKGIALLQLTWFIVQVITRAVQGLAITELELTTAALAGLNSVMYIFWWSKPRDVRFPVVVRTKGVEELLAKRLPEDVAWNFSYQEFDIQKHIWVLMTTTIGRLFGAIAHTFTSLPKTVSDALLSFFKVVKAIPHSISRSFSQMCRYFAQIGGACTDESQKRNTRKGLNDRHVNLNEGQEPINSEISDDAQAMSPASNINHARMKPIVPTIIDGLKSTLGFALLPFYALVYLVDLMLFVPIRSIVKTDGDFDSLSGIIQSGYNTETKEGTFAMIFYSEDAGVKPLLTTSSIAGALFGAVHCLAWHFSFPSHAEQILWRTASLGIVGSCVVTFLTVLCFDLIDRVGDVLFNLSLAPCGLASFVYPVARITLLVLAITSLRSLPLSALDTVDWVEFFPHI